MRVRSPAKSNALPSDKGKSFAETAWDTSMTAVLSGYFLSPNGHELYLYKWGSSMTHQGCEYDHFAHCVVA